MIKINSAVLTNLLLRTHLDECEYENFHAEVVPHVYVTNITKIDKMKGNRGSSFWTKYVAKQKTGIIQKNERCEPRASVLQLIKEFTLGSRFNKCLITNKKGWGCPMPQRNKNTILKDSNKRYKKLEYNNDGFNFSKSHFQTM